MTKRRRVSAVGCVNVPPELLGHIYTYCRIEDLFFRITLVSRSWWVTAWSAHNVYPAYNEVTSVGNEVSGECTWYIVWNGLWQRLCQSPLASERTLERFVWFAKLMSGYRCAAYGDRSDRLVLRWLVHWAGRHRVYTLFVKVDCLRRGSHVPVVEDGRIIGCKAPVVIRGRRVVDFCNARRSGRFAQADDDDDLIDDEY